MFRDMEYVAAIIVLYSIARESDQMASWDLLDEMEAEFKGLRGERAGEAVMPG